MLNETNHYSPTADVSKAEEPDEPLVPVFTSWEADIHGPLYGQAGCDILVTSSDSGKSVPTTVESHPGPIVSTRETEKVKFPEVPVEARQVKDDFYFPLGEYLQIAHDLLKLSDVSVIPRGPVPSAAQTYYYCYSTQCYLLICPIPVRNSTFIFKNCLVILKGYT